jgi:predicted amidohydrolase
MSMSTTNKIAVAQLCSTSSKLDNLVKIAECAGQAKREGCLMLFLPECFGFLGESSQQTLQQAEPPVLEDQVENDSAITKTLKSIVARTVSEEDQTPDDDLPSNTHVSLLDGLRTIARESGLWISAGGMHVAADPADAESSCERVYNTHVVLDNQGEVQGIYRKIHLFDVSIPGKVNLRESATTAPGKELVVCDSPVGKFRSSSQQCWR